MCLTPGKSAFRLVPKHAASQRWLEIDRSGTRIVLLPDGDDCWNESINASLNPGSVVWSSLMRKSNWTPSIVPNGHDQTVYLVADDFGEVGRAWREADYETTDLETVIQDLLTGQYSNPIRIISFNTAERWSEDVSADVAHELRHRCDLQQRDIPFFLQEFCDRHEGRYHDVQLSLPIRLV